MTPPTGGGANRGGPRQKSKWVNIEGKLQGKEGDFGFVIWDFILVDGYISGVGGPRVEPGAKRDGGPGGARAFFNWPPNKSFDLAQDRFGG